MCSVLYLIYETSQWNTYNKKTVMKEIKELNGSMVLWRKYEARTQGNHKQDHDQP